MKFICTQDNLIRGLNTVVHIAGRNTSLPILSNILIKTTNAGLELVATNLEVAILTNVRGKVEEEGSITIQAKLLTDSVSLMVGEKITIETKNNDLVLVSDKKKTIIRGVAAEDYPVIPEIGEGVEYNINNEDLVGGLNKVVCAVNNDESRPEISGVYLYQKEDMMIMVGTDSYRLAEFSVKQNNTNLSNGIIIPLKTTQEIIRCGQAGEVSKLIISDSQMSWQSGDIQIISRLLSGQYPDYQPIIPQNTTTLLKINKEDFVKAIKAASIFSRSGINDVRLMVNSVDKKLTISSSDNQLGENNSEITLIGCEGDDNEAVFNYRYLLDGLQNINDKEVWFGLVGANSPAIIKSDDDVGYLYVIMPIRQ